MGAGASVGLIIGGVLTDLVSWRWVLFINVPLGLAVAALAPRFVRQPETHPAKFDVTGAITSTIGMGALVYALIQVGNKGWSDRTAQIAFAVAVVMLIAFLIIEQRVTQPITPLHLFANAGRAGAYTATLLLTAAMFSVLFLLTQFQQGVLSFTPIQAGLAFLPMTVMQFFAVRLVPKLLPRIGARPLLIAGALLIVGGMVWLTQLSTTSNYIAALFVPLFMIGLGVGVSFPTLNMTIMSGVAPQDSGAASGLLQTLQWLGGTLGLAIFVTVLGSASRDVAGQPVGASATEQAAYGLTHGITAAFLAAGISAAGALVLAFFAPGKPAAKEEEEPKPATTPAASTAAAKEPQLVAPVQARLAPMHNPVWPAKNLASLDVASGGWLIAGLGSGWSLDEYAAVAPRPFRERGAALDEFLDVAEALWGPDPVSYKGSVFELAPGRFGPKPLGDIPIFLGGATPPVLRRIARRGLGWLPNRLPPARIVEIVGQIREPTGTDVPCVVAVNYPSMAEVPAASRQPYAGSPQQLMEDLVMLAEGGITHACVSMLDTADNVTKLIDAAEELYTEAKKAGLV